MRGQRNCKNCGEAHDTWKMIRWGKIKGEENNAFKEIKVPVCLKCWRELSHRRQRRFKERRWEDEN